MRESRVSCCSKRWAQIVNSLGEFIARAPDQSPAGSVGSICTNFFLSPVLPPVARESQRDGRCVCLRTRFTSEPTRTDAFAMWLIFSGPTIETCLIQCRPLLIAQPHCEQSGVPPKTH